MKYRSRISVLLSVFMLCIFSIPLLGNDIENIAEVLMIGLPFIFALSIFVTINYTISNNNLLVIKCFGFKMASIDIHRIKTIKCSYNPISSPAASLRRLEVKFYHKGKLESGLISPVREDDFLAKLKEINPNIEIRVTPKNNILHFRDWDI